LSTSQTKEIQYVSGRQFHRNQTEGIRQLCICLWERDCECVCLCVCVCACVCVCERQEMRVQAGDMGALFPSQKQIKGHKRFMSHVTYRTSESRKAKRS